MTGSLFAFWVVVYVTLWLLKRRPHSIISRAAFTWIGPQPVAGQTWAAYQGRWAMYSFWWLCQISVIFSGLWFYASRHPGIASQPWFLVLGFPWPIGAGMALLATVAFLFKTAKAHYIGPNPIWTSRTHE